MFASTTLAIFDTCWHYKAFSTSKERVVNKVVRAVINGDSKQRDLHRRAVTRHAQKKTTTKRIWPQFRTGAAACKKTILGPGSKPGSVGLKLLTVVPRSKSERQTISLLLHLLARGDSSPLGCLGLSLLSDNDRRMYFKLRGSLTRSCTIV